MARFLGKIASVCAQVFSGIFPREECRASDQVEVNSCANSRKASKRYYLSVQITVSFGQIHCIFRFKTFEDLV